MHDLDPATRAAVQALSEARGFPRRTRADDVIETIIALAVAVTIGGIALGWCAGSFAPGHRLAAVEPAGTFLSIISTGVTGIALLVPLKLLGSIVRLLGRRIRSRA